MVETLGVEGSLGVLAAAVWLVTTAVSSVGPRRRHFIVPQSPSAAAGGATPPLNLGEEPLSLHGHVEARRVAMLYLPVYALGTLGDWMQGGHLFALYQSYGYSISEIGHIFAIGYSSAALLGTYAAAFGDRHGYRLCVVVYGLCYTLECLSMNYRSVGMLIGGRLCGGIAYSLLYVSFESWLVAEGHARSLPTEYMGHLFATATTVNAISAVIGGALAHISLELYRDSAEEVRSNIYTTPFNAATVPLLGCSLLATLLWQERYAREAPVAHSDECPEDVRETSRLTLDGAPNIGEDEDEDEAGSPLDRLVCIPIDGNAAPSNSLSPARTNGKEWPVSSATPHDRERSRRKSHVIANGRPAGGGASSGSAHASITGSLIASLARLRREPILFHIGMLSSLYEATLYAFVFLWTPALEARARASALAAVGGDESLLVGELEIAHGKIFSLLMLFKAAGSRVFATGLGRVTHLPGGVASQRSFALRSLKLTFAVSAACLALPIFSERYDVTLCAFCAFELMLGFYWPAVAMLRTDFVVEGRSSMMSVFRVLLNVLVIGLLELSGVLSERHMFAICCAMLVASWTSTLLLEARVLGSKPMSLSRAGPKASRSDDLENYDDLGLREVLAEEYTTGALQRV
jgi:hypothetical protein